MLFVNEIGEIVHSVVNQFSGAANKNVGDAFLLVWKFEEEDQVVEEFSDEVRLVECSRVSQLADMAVISFLLLIAGIRKSKKMKKYNYHKGLNMRLKGFEVKLGLGLHLGYAIEGAIGSYYKIDASYLSPNVRMSERLEGATKHYGVPMLISGSLHRYLTRTTRNYCRQVDFCQMKGNTEPAKLYTIDVDTRCLTLEKQNKYFTLTQSKIQRVHQRIKRQQLRDAAFANEIQISDFFHTNQDIVLMRQPFPTQWLQTYSRAFRNYVNGNWDEAIEDFSEVLKLHPKDKPTHLLLEFMAECNNVPPANWQGFKYLDE